MTTAGAVRVRRRSAALAVLLSLALLAGCGVSAEETPRRIASPAGHLPTVLPAPPRPAESGTLIEQLCYIRDDTLVVVNRRVPTPSDPQTQLQLLLDGPTEAERDTGLTSTLTGSSIITGVRVSNGEAVVDVAEGLAGTGRNDEIFAFGQIVCTLTSRADVTRVSFRHENAPLGVPRADGSLSVGPLTEADYAEMIAPR